MFSVLIAVFEIRLEDDLMPFSVAANHCFVDSINWQSKEELKDELDKLMMVMMARAEDETETMDEPFLCSLSIQHFPDSFKRFL